MSRDQMHLLGGLLVAIAQAAVIEVALRAGPGWALALGCVLVGVGIEAYQHVRGEGVPTLRGAVTSAAAGVVLGAAYEILI